MGRFFKIKYIKNSLDFSFKSTFRIIIDPKWENAI